jgi:ligand-binding SRPBCC domain-containing protein
MHHELHTTFELPLPIDRVFAFFADAQNLERITPPELRFEILTPADVEIGLGTLLEYRLRLLGVPFGWLTRIAAWDPPHGFIDVQLRGPYAVWEHTHAFVNTGDTTVVDDHVRYRLPLAPFGDAAYPYVSRQLARIFAYRRRAVMQALLGQADLVEHLALLTSRVRQ